jgi:hypothetical protein
MRSTIQANRGQASILQGLPAETPETPVLISLIFFIFFFFFLFLPVLYRCPVAREIGYGSYRYFASSPSASLLRIW